jgi:zinc D-Ala-D-Ala dipeptidase
MRRFLCCVGSLILGLSFCAVRAEEQSTPKNELDLVDAKEAVPSLLVELKYATKDNFLKKNIYGDLRKCFVRRSVALMLAKAAETLQRIRPNLRLLAYDCYRPAGAQKQMWDAVKGTWRERYVADPNQKPGSLHGSGCAVDMTLADAEDKPLDMGSPFDSFGQMAQPRHELNYRKEGELTGEQLSNRLLLRWVMVEAGFVPIISEWWHFNCAAAPPKKER